MADRTREARELALDAIDAMRCCWDSELPGLANEAEDAVLALAARVDTLEAALRPENAETVARLFHETYERRAPHFGYQTRHAVPWESVPLANKCLMTAVAEEVLAALADAEPKEPQ